MRSRVEAALEKINSNGWVEKLQNCITLEEKYKELYKLLPEVSEWEVSIAKRQLLCSIQENLNVYLGVCEFYWASDHRQYCLLDRSECICSIPQTFCVLRDKGRKLKLSSLIS